MRRCDSPIAIAVLCLIALSTAIQLGRAADRGPSTPEEREQAVKLVRALEMHPLHEGAKDARQWLTVWLIEIPDITVKFCLDILGPFAKSEQEYSTELSAQMLYSGAAFIIEHPDKAKDDHAVYLAGVEGTLKAYEALLKEKPAARHAFLDELLEKRKKDELSAYVRKAMKKCK